MASKHITYDKTGHIAYIKLNHPEARNAINRAMAEQLADVCQKINQDDDVRVAVITGEGDYFSSGETENETASAMASSAVASLKYPVIAMLNGDAISSGLELALACDIRLALKESHLGFPEVASGKIPSGGGTQRLPRIVGRGKALELILTGEIIDSTQAWEIGLINRVYSPSELPSETDNLANKLLSKGPVAERYAKEAISKGMDMTIGQGLRLEADLSFILQSTRDRTEGIEAFLQKRAPEFKGE
ncbi:MAG: enoyl-CoA hydratase/isomerase family protein [Dehalococcoidia bacterium]